MRNLAATALLSASLLLGGCATFGGGGTAPNWDALVTQVQQAAAAVCSFVPTAQTVLDILSLGHPAFATASQIAGAICASVSAPRQARRAGESPAPPTVGGVVVRGRFVGR